MAQRWIKHWEAHDRLLFGSHETSPIIWIGKPAPVLVKLIVERWQVGPKHYRGGWGPGGEGVKTTENKNILAPLNGPHEINFVLPV
jgi:hypothetical protein